MLRRVGLVAVVSIVHLFPLVAGEAFHTIHVGTGGSFYDPATILANLNDVVTFIFDGPFHDVTQSTFAKPCQPLAGGFGSGISGKGNNGSAPSPSWSIRITNASVPIWFYCGATIPVPHCTTGMVGAINPPSIDAYNQFLLAAKNVSLNVPVQAPSVVLSGQGAFATATPQVTGTPTGASILTSASASSTSSTSTVGATETAVPAASTSSSISTGSIVGAAVGGGVGFVIICFLGVLVYRALRKDKHAAAISPYTDSGTRRGQSDDANNRSMSQLKINRSPSDPILSGTGQLSSLPSTTASPPPTMAYTPPSTSHGILGPAIPSDPPRRIRPLPPSPQPNNTTFSHNEQPSSPGVYGAQSTSDQQPGSHPVNINELAREVAALLHTQSSKSNLEAASGFSQLDEEERRGRHSADFSVVSSPPHYYQH